MMKNEKNIRNGIPSTEEAVVYCNEKLDPNLHEGKLREVLEKPTDVTGGGAKYLFQRTDKKDIESVVRQGENCAANMGDPSPQLILKEYWESAVDYLPDFPNEVYANAEEIQRRIRRSLPPIPNYIHQSLNNFGEKLNNINQSIGYSGQESLSWIITAMLSLGGTIILGVWCCRRSRAALRNGRKQDAARIPDALQDNREAAPIRENSINATAEGQNLVLNKIVGFSKTAISVLKYTVPVAEYTISSFLKIMKSIAPTAGRMFFSILKPMAPVTIHSVLPKVWDMIVGGAARIPGVLTLRTSNSFNDTDGGTMSGIKNGPNLSTNHSGSPQEPITTNTATRSDVEHIGSTDGYITTGESEDLINLRAGGFGSFGEPLDQGQQRSETPSSVSAAQQQLGAATVPNMVGLGSAASGTISPDSNNPASSAFPPPPDLSSASSAVTFPRSEVERHQQPVSSSTPENEAETLPTTSVTQQSPEATTDERKLAQDINSEGISKGLVKGPSPDITDRGREFLESMDELFGYIEPE
ncbi:hypothetical protein [unidentified bacterial endosymbiont]|uniref:hypothetical protein n=1 Tax=unidentified bacterial endosymbiont TaxID=2355 RepID=UPI0020A1F34B|nr:hypothetical protein [unidentified bacterial endosymbiont]